MGDSASSHSSAPRDLFDLDVWQPVHAYDGRESQFLTFEELVAFLRESHPEVTLASAAARVSAIVRTAVRGRNGYVLLPEDLAIRWHQDHHFPLPKPGSSYYIGLHGGLVLAGWKD